MTLYRIPISYKPKEYKVWRGECCQSIRPDRGIQSGDELLLWIWSGVPYRSKWIWQRRTKVVSAYPIIVYKEGIVLFNDFKLFAWDSPQIQKLAEDDGIDPATGEALRDALFKFNGVPGKDGTRCQIIRW